MGTIHQSTGEIHSSTSCSVSFALSTAPTASGAAPPEGFHVHGSIVSKRPHSVKDARGDFHRYIMLIVNVKHCRKRTKDEKTGEENGKSRIRFNTFSDSM